MEPEFPFIRVGGNCNSFAGAGTIQSGLGVGLSIRADIAAGCGCDFRDHILSDGRDAIHFAQQRSTGRGMSGLHSAGIVQPAPLAVCRRGWAAAGVKNCSVLAAKAMTRLPFRHSPSGTRPFMHGMPILAGLAPACLKRDSRPFRSDIDIILLIFALAMFALTNKE